MRRVIATLSALFIVLLFGASPAAAHGGKIKLDVAGDGATGVTVRALYQSDGHPVEDKVLRLTLTATADAGRTAGPFDLGPSAEGRGFYSSGAVLTPGRWTVVVTSVDPNVIRAESTVDARAAQAAPAPAPTATGSANGSDVTAAEEGDGGGTLWTVLFVVALALAGLALVLVRRRASPTASRRAGGRPEPTGRPRRHG